MEEKVRAYKRKLFRGDLINYLIVIIFYAVMELLLRTGNLSSLMKGILVPLCTYAILAVALNLCVGILGELSLGHAGFMCVGAFSSAFFTNAMEDAIPNAGFRFFLAFLIGIAVAAVFGFLIGIPVLRLNGDYLAIVTLAFGEIIKNIINALYVGVDENGIHASLQNAGKLDMSSDGVLIINGAQGISGTPKQSTFTIGILLLLLTLFIVQNLIRSRTGRAVMAIRDNRIAAEATGINITKYKLLAFTISAALCGMAGVLYAHNIASLAATTNRFGYNMSITILVFVVLGGIGNMRGSMIAAVVLTMLPEMLRFLSNYRMLIYSIVLIAMMILTSGPKVVAKREQWLDKIRQNKKKKKEAA